MNDSEANEQSPSRDETMDHAEAKGAAIQLANIMYQWIWYREK